MGLSREEALKYLAMAKRVPRPNYGPGVISYRTSGYLPPEMAAEEEERRLSLLSDEGLLGAGSEEASVKRALLIENIIAAGTIWRLCVRYVIEKGIVLPGHGKNRNKQVVNPLMLTMGAFMNTERRGLMELGLERRARKVPSLQEYITEIETKRAVVANEDAQEMGDPGRQDGTPVQEDGDV